jgi:hypothetical protein
MVAFLDSRKAERATARGVRKEAMEAAAEEAGGTTHVARSTEEFWALFSAKAKGSCFRMFCRWGRRLWARGPPCARIAVACTREAALRTPRPP